MSTLLAGRAVADARGQSSALIDGGTIVFPQGVAWDHPDGPGFLPRGWTVSHGGRTVRRA